MAGRSSFADAAWRDLWQHPWMLIGRLRPGNWLQKKGLCALLALTTLLLYPAVALPNPVSSTCHAVAEFNSPAIGEAALAPIPANFTLNTNTSDAYNVSITYVGHSTFRIESPENVVIATDYNGFGGHGSPPNIVTMNHAHGTHYTLTPDPAIDYVTRGWGENEAPAQHFFKVKDVLIRNVPTDIYHNGVMLEEKGNSIFIFEIAGLCIGHLGHLHHTLSEEHYAAIGRVDVLMVPVDGSYTMSQESMAEIAKRLKSSIILPMHYFSQYSLQRYMQQMAGSFATQITTNPTLSVSVNTLPAKPTVVGILLQ